MKTIGASFNPAPHGKQTVRILYLHQYFNTPDMPGGTRSYEMGRRLVAAGHEVHMVTSYRTDPEGGRKGWWVTDESGIHVHWKAVPYSNRLPFRDRLKTFVQFAWAASRRSVHLPADVVFATSTPLTIAIPALYAAWRQRVPLVFEVRDLWPEAPVQLGALNNPIAIRVARYLERLTYRRSAHVIGLSPGMVAGIIQAGVDPARVSMIPNSSDLDLFHPDVDGTPLRKKLGLEGFFTLAYFGTMGIANGLDFVLDCAAELRSRGANDIRLVLHGDGSEKDRLVRRAATDKLDNVIFSDPVASKREVAELASAVDVCMTIYKDVPILYTCSPNKMFDSFAAGRPVLTNMPGWLQSLVEENRCGVFVPPGNTAAFADQVISMRDQPQLCEEYGRNARDLAEKVFSRDLLGKQLERVLARAVEQAGPGSLPSPG